LLILAIASRKKATRTATTMPTYLVTFKLVQNQSYGERTNNFMSTLEAWPWWGETGSTIIVDADLPLAAFCRRLFRPACFDEDVDIAVVIDLDGRVGMSKGHFRDYGLLRIAPWLERA
jgi:hypothetical protein